MMLVVVEWGRWNRCEREFKGRLAGLGRLGKGTHQGRQTL